MLFPKLSGKSVGYVNLDTEARLWIKERGLGTEQNPLIDSSICQTMVDDVHKKYGLDYSYGGWFEDRSFLWKGSYLDKTGTYTHLGVDFNAPAFTEIALDFDGEVVLVGDDHPLDGGWGPHVVVKHQNLPLYFIFAHLDRDPQCAIGDILKKDQIFAKVGKAPYNGNWFSHLHLQAIEQSFFDQLIANNAFDSLDGYGLVKDTEANARRFKDPLAYVELE
ncbi:MAG: peptidoglycan DD-metalloendopeptidase family protein [bacterium]